MINKDYWEQEGAKKKFTHKIQESWLTGLEYDISILDYGCGYGRITKQLYNTGFKNIIGYDTSLSLIQKADLENPGPRYTTRLDFSNAYDLIICFALFTSCPTNKEQINIIDNINRLSHSSSKLFVSDYLTTDNPEYSARYNENNLGIYGCFVSGGGIFRHHKPEYFSGLFKDWFLQKELSVLLKTLNGNPVTAHQYLFSKNQ